VISAAVRDFSLASWRGRDGFVMTEFHGGGAAGITASVEYHLRRLVNAGELEESD